MFDIFHKEAWNLFIFRVDLDGAQLPESDALYMMEHQHFDPEERLFVSKCILNADKVAYLFSHYYHMPVIETADMKYYPLKNNITHSYICTCLCTYQS